MRPVPKGIRLILLVGMLSIGGIVALRAYIHFSLRGLHIGDLSGEVRTLRLAADQARAAIRVQGENCAIRIDESSIGANKEEAAILTLASLTNLYRLKFGSAPPTVAALSDIGEFTRTNRSGMSELERDCFIHNDMGGWSVIGCGHWQPSGADLAALRLGADRTERFYKLGKHEVLYIPSAGCGEVKAAVSQSLE